MKSKSKKIDVCITYTNNNTFQSQWDYVLSHFVPNTIYVIGAPKKDVFEGNNVFKTAKHIKTAEKLPKNKPLVLMAPINGRYIKGTKSLVSFTHPKNATYLFGPDNMHLSEDHMGSRKPDYKVYIPADTKDDMYSFMAAAITFYDRRIKNG